MMGGKLKERNVGPKIMMKGSNNNSRIEKKPPAKKEESDDNYDESDFEENKEEDAADNPMEALRKKIAKENAKGLEKQKKREEAQVNTSALKKPDKKEFNFMGGGSGA
jgi:hypothetical protein